MRHTPHKPLLIVLAVLLCLAILAAITMSGSSTSWLESAVGAVFQPIGTFASNVSNGIVNFFERLFKTGATDLENEQLKGRVLQLEQQVAELLSQKQENERLKKLLQYTQSYPELTFVTGTVTGAAQGAWFDSFNINLGRSQGIAPNMPVVTGDGLVGYISEVGANWSRVTTIVGASASASVMVNRTRDNGMVRGASATDKRNAALELYYLPINCDLTPGDAIITNGLDGVYPKGLAVGTVSEVSRSSSDYNALLTPAVDFSHIEEVMVITNLPQETGK